MNEILLVAFRHKLWAMKKLIALCRERSVDELTQPAAGYGSILATLNHLVLADAGYVASLGGGRAEQGLQSFAQPFAHPFAMRAA